MQLNQQKEQFSEAYVRAVAAVAGFTMYKPEVDDDSVDWGIAQRGGNGTTRSPRVELQLKCTSQDIVKNEHLGFDLTIKNYNDLRPDNYLVPRILIVVVVPTVLAQWLEHDEDNLVLKHCGYWSSLRGMGTTKNSANVRVSIPRSDRFTVAALQVMMQRVEGGGYP